MTKQVKAAIAAMLLVGAVSAQAQAGGAASAAAPVKKTRAAKPKKETPEQIAIRELQEKIAAQQAQIDTLTQQNTAKDAAVSQAQSAATAAQTQANTASTEAQAAAASAQTQGSELNTLKSTVSDLQSTSLGVAQTINTTKADLDAAIESPAAIHYKGVTIQPIGFLAFEGVWRQRSVNSDVNTPLNSIPFPSANEGHTSELNLSGRQSRIGALVIGNAGKYTLTGYYEMDFLGTGTSSNNNQSNSYVLRQRQIWGQVATSSNFAVTGGQMWSLATEMRRGTDARTEIQPQTIDAQYLVGYTWVRQPEIRIQQRFGNYNTGAFTGAISVEQAQITGFTANGTNPNQFFFGGLGQNGGLYNAAAASAGATTTTTTCTTPTGTITCITGVTATASDITAYANNVAPDFIVKGAFDLPLLHVELGGIARFLRDQYFPVATYGGTASAPTYTYNTTRYLKHTSVGGGVFGAARSYIGKPGTYPAVEVAVQAMAGTGVGRYGSSQLADATLRPDETLEPIRNYHGLFSLESHLSPKFDVFAYYGGEYAQRTVYAVPVSGALVGYGTPNTSNAGCYNLPGGTTAAIGNSGFQGSLGASTCGSPTKYIQEAMIGFQFRPIVSAKYGRLQYSATYSLIQRQLWSGVASATTPASPRAQDSMIHVQMRYYIP